MALAKESFWDLDNLGNWTLFERHTDRDGDGTYGESGAGEGWQYTLHDVDSANQITTHASYGKMAVPLGEDAFLYDLAGNLIYDGTYIYQYDAWNRLVQVNQRGDLEYTPADPDNDDFDAAGRIDPNPNNNPVHAIGTLVAQYRYDGVGRLIVAYEATDLGTPTYQTVHFYYDGVRRIQEVVEQEGDDLTRAEYVYGPDYVDEFILQTYNVEDEQVPMYMLQDGNYNVVALLGGEAQVLEQYTWDPYGTLLIKDTQATPDPINRVGHQGLFWHSLDASETFNAPDPATDPTPTATGLYYNRNRWYVPHLGRFLQKDPNESAMLVLGALARNGETFATLLGSFQGLSHFGDGMNLYGYQGLNPVHGVDPAGLALYHFYPMYLGGAPDGPGLELTSAQHSRFHKALNDMIGAGPGDDARAKWIAMGPNGQKNALTVAAAEAGIDVTDRSFKSLLADAMAVAQPGENLSPMRKCPSPRWVKMVADAEDLTYTRGVRLVTKGANIADLADRATRGIALAGGMMAGINMIGMISDPALADLASITERVRKTGTLSIMDEVFVFHDLMQLTGDAVASAHGWNYWRETMGY